MILDPAQARYLHELYLPSPRRSSTLRARLSRRAAHLWSRLVHRIIRRAQRTPYSHLAGYMNRWWLIDPVDSKQSAGARVHQILRSDKDRDKHSHPFPFISLVLRRGYFEITPKDQKQHPALDVTHYERKWRGPGSIAFRRASDRHSIELLDGRPAWTLFLQFRKKYEWGFFTPTEFVHWTLYDTYKIEEQKRPAAHPKEAA